MKKTTEYLEKLYITQDGEPKSVHDSVENILDVFKQIQIDVIEETCRVCAEEANLVINNLSCTDKDYNDYYQCGDDEISVNRQLILSVAEKLKKELE